jgi:prophage regulatory protein
MQHTESHAVKAAQEPLPPRFMRLPMVMNWTGLGRSTIYRMIAAQTFPAPVVLGTRAVAWRLTDLEQRSADRRPSRH